MDRPVTVSCGQCRGCRLERSRQWAVRCLHEASLHEKNSFITLTYNPENLPADGSLDLTHWQLFVRRARKKMGSFRYYHCGEYGDLYGRPHLHACLFGLDFSEDRRKWKIINGNQLFTSRTLEELWPQGFCTIGAVTFESAAYCARYIMKKVNGDQAANHYQGLKPEYTTMSRRPGLAAKWIEKHGGDVYRRDEVIVNGKPRHPPKYYDSQFEIVEPKIIEGIKNKRAIGSYKHKANATPERLAIREKVQIAKAKQYTREPEQ